MDYFLLFFACLCLLRLDLAAASSLGASSLGFSSVAAATGAAAFPAVHLASSGSLANSAANLASLADSRTLTNPATSWSTSVLQSTAASAPASAFFSSGLTSAGLTSAAGSSFLLKRAGVGIKKPLASYLEGSSFFTPAYSAGLSSTLAGAADLTKSSSQLLVFSAATSTK